MLVNAADFHKSTEYNNSFLKDRAIKPSSYMKHIAASLFNPGNADSNTQEDFSNIIAEEKNVDFPVLQTDRQGWVVSFKDT